MEERKAVIEAAETLLMEITRSIVYEPAAVGISSEERVGCVALVLKLSGPDLNLFHNQSGRTIRALRTILDATSERSGYKLLLDVVSNN